MADKVGELRKLLRDGWTLESIDTDDDSVVTTLRQGAHARRLRLYRTDAEAILLDLPRAGVGRVRR